jgi:sn-glycerol 3-phosphate transport system substrate-binding protein
MRHGRRTHGARRIAAAAVALAAATGSCGGSGGDGARSGGCDPRLPAGTRTPVRITMWHVMTASHEDRLREMVEQFHARQQAVRVRLVRVASYDDVLVKLKAGLASGDVADVIQAESGQLQTLIDSRATVPVGDCVRADRYPTDDFLAPALALWTTEGTLRAMPWNTSSTILYLDAGAFREAGLDPARPPRTLDEVRAASEAIVRRGVRPHGIALRAAGYLMSALYSRNGLTLVNHDNGRGRRATAATLASPRALRIWEWWADMARDGLLLDVGPKEGIDHFLAVGNKQAAMTIDGSPSLGPIIEVLGTGQFPGVEPGAGPTPGLRPDGGPALGDGALFISARTTPARRAAAWRFIRFLVAPPRIATLGVEGFIPVRRSAVGQPELQRRWAEQPAFRVAYDQLRATPDTPATAGAVIPDGTGFTEAITDALVRMLSGALTPREAMREAQRAATASIREYNRRLGR